MEQDNNGQYFVPFDIDFTAKPFLVKWIEARGLDLSKPFFFQSVDANLKNNCKTFSSPIEAISKLANAMTHQNDCDYGFIFHSSRCGSTLIKNQLNGLPTTFVLSEPQPLSAILLEADRSITLEDGTLLDMPRLFQDLLKIYFVALSRLNSKNKMLIKFVSWGTVRLPWIQEKFPQIRSLFVFRNPVEIIISLMRSANPPAKSAAKFNTKIASKITSIPESLIETLSYEEYLAQTIANYLNIALQCIPKGTIKKLDYEELSFESFLSILKWFDIEETADLAYIYDEISKQHSKDPTKTFSSDSQQKREAAPKSLIEIIERSANPIYLRLKSHNYS